MDATSSFLSDRQFQCSICLDIFNEPVTIPCGHNFCLACLSRHWADKLHCQCPLCNERFTKDIKLRVNIVFREVVENFKKCHVNSSVTPGQVPCDCCPGNKIRALKTCLVCLTSYCEAHLEPHHRVPSLRRHKLTNPVQKLEDKICQKHNRILEFFCKDDQTRVCSLCTEHGAHDTVPLEEEYIDKRAQMGKSNVQVQKNKQRLGKKAQKKVAAQTKMKGKERASSVGSDQMGDVPNENPQSAREQTYIPVNYSLPDGNFYYEVETSRVTSVNLGVVRELMYRDRTALPDSGAGHWIVMLEGKTCRAPHHIPVWTNKPEAITLFVDHEKGFLSFSDEGVPVLTFPSVRCKFTQSLSLLFIPYVSWTQKLQRRVQSIAQSSEAFNWFIALLLFVAVILWMCQ